MKVKLAKSTASKRIPPFPPSLPSTHAVAASAAAAVFVGEILFPDSTLLWYMQCIGVSPRFATFSASQHPFGLQFDRSRQNMLVLAGHSGQKIFLTSGSLQCLVAGGTMTSQIQTEETRLFTTESDVGTGDCFSPHRPSSRPSRVARAQLHSYADSAMTTRSRKGRVSGGGARERTPSSGTKAE